MASDSRDAGDVNCGRCGAASVCLTTGWLMFSLKLVRCNNCHKMFFMRGEAAERYDVHAISRVRLDGSCEERWLIGADRRAEITAAKCPACGNKPWAFLRWNTQVEKQEILDRAQARHEESERLRREEERKEREAGQLPLFASPDTVVTDLGGIADDTDDNVDQEAGDE